MTKDSLGDRMKNYENIERKYLTKRMPCIIRIDGKAFHSFTKGFQKPFDEVFIKTMWETAQFLCENIMGCKIAYVQSDEISLLLTDYDTITTEAWFNKNVQKMVSVSASKATLAFNKRFIKNLLDWTIQNSIVDYKIAYQKAIMVGAMFDSRVFIVPKEDVCNYFIWRQQDATRNAIQMVGRANFSDKQMYKKNTNQVQEMLFQEKSINFNDYPVYQKRGACIIKESYKHDGQVQGQEEVLRTRWVVDKEIPIFTQDRMYIEQYL